MSNPFIFVPIATFGTSFISGLTGLGGGAILMGFLGSILNPIQAIYLHACFQALSNIFRLCIHWKDVDKFVFMFFSITVLPGSYLGAQLLGSLPVHILRIVLGIGLLLSLIPKKKKQKDLPGFAYSILGFLAGLMGCLMGAVGPLLARFLLRPGMSHGYFVGTKSACQFIVHLGKVLFLGKIAVENSIMTDPYILIGFAGIFFGNYIAKFVGKKIPKETFQKLVKLLLLLIGCQLILKGLNFYFHLW